MTTLQELETIVPEMVREMEDIAGAMSRYKKIETDGRARVLINEINGKIKAVKKVHEIYKRSPSFQNQNFDDFVKMYKGFITEFWDLYHRIKKFEDVKDYH